MQASIDEYARSSAGVTRIVIAHRLSTVKHANTIAFVKNGQVLETGTHAVCGLAVWTSDGVTR